MSYEGHNIEQLGQGLKANEQGLGNVYANGMRTALVSGLWVSVPATATIATVATLRAGRDDIVLRMEFFQKAPAQGTPITVVSSRIGWKCAALAFCDATIAIPVFTW
jgi:hypothetical protein